MPTDYSLSAASSSSNKRAIIDDEGDKVPDLLPRERTDDLSSSAASPSSNKRPIRVPKPPYRKKEPNMFDGTDTPDQRDNFEFLHQSEVGRLIRKSTKPRLTDDDITPAFSNVTFQNERDGPYLETHFKCGENTPPQIRTRLIQLIKKYWCCFARRM